MFLNQKNEIFTEVVGDILSKRWVESNDVSFAIFRQSKLNPRIHSECEEIQARPISNVDTFHNFTKLLE